MAEQDLMYGVAAGVAKGMISLEAVYCLEQEKFYIYKDGRWQIISNIELLSIISQTEIFHWVCNHSIHTRKQILENLKMLIFKPLECFNATGWLNFDLGEFDPVTLQMHDHNKKHYSTFRIPYPYHASAPCELWTKTLNEIFDNDKNKISILQEFFGYCLTRDVRKEKALLLLGQSRTGKSTILEILSYMIGEENCAFVSLDYVFHPQYSPLLMNKLVNIDTDVSSKAEDYEREFKTITSGEPLVCNQKFVETFKFRPYCKMVLAANEFPRIKDHSSAFYNRLLLLPCDRVFSEMEQNRLLKDKLKEELSGIFNWSVLGLKRLNERGKFEEYDFMKEAVKDLEDENNPINLFFRENIKTNVIGGKYIEKGELFKRYKEWSELNKQLTLPAAKFSNIFYKNFSKFTPKSAHLPDGKRIWRNLEFINNNGFLEGENVQW